MGVVPQATPRALTLPYPRPSLNQHTRTPSWSVGATFWANLDADSSHWHRGSGARNYMSWEVPFHNKQLSFELRCSVGLVLHFPTELASTNSVALIGFSQLSWGVLTI
jgi:hypothetical protein